MTKNSTRGMENRSEKIIGVEWKRMENVKMIEDYRQGRQKRSNICINGGLEDENRMVHK